MDSKGAKSLLSGELASLTGVSKDTLRHYERIGVLQTAERTDSRYRLYPQTAVRRVLTIRAALAIGISLPELVEIFAVRSSGQAPCEDVRRIVQRRLDAVVKQIESLVVFRDQLTTLLQDWDDRLGRRLDGELSHLLETLVPEETQ